MVTNSEGLSSKARRIISTAAPGVFTVAGDGRGEAIVLNSDTFMTVDHLIRRTDELRLVDLRDWRGTRE